MTFWCWACISNYHNHGITFKTTIKLNKCMMVLLFKVHNIYKFLQTKKKKLVTSTFYIFFIRTYGRDETYYTFFFFPLILFHLQMNNVNGKNKISKK